MQHWTCKLDLSKKYMTIQSKCVSGLKVVTLWGCGSSLGDVQLEDPAEVTSDEISAMIHIRSGTSYQFIPGWFLQFVCWIYLNMGKYFDIALNTFHLHYTIWSQRKHSLRKKKSVVTSPSIGRLLFPFNWRISVEFIQDGFEIVVLSFNKPEVYVLYFPLQVDVQSRVFCLWCKTPGYGQVTGPTTRMP